ncbi:MAG: acyl-CoA thioesterase II [Rhizobiaceae bacterium]|nr:acyl-CoA thioesterase II [Rhizobiaceae bacterium]MCV0407640.1 acyl-CoA thioesterase II [Rhizobiaceae bacterium]
MAKAMQDVLDILNLERLEHNLFRGRSPQVGWQRVFGGQVIGQALVAAQRTVPADRPVHSLHGYFMLPGDPKVPIIYDVDRIRDGGSFATRRVVAIQHGHAIFSLEASFQVAEPGLDHQTPMPPDVPPPEELKTQGELLGELGDRLPANVYNFWSRDRALDIKPVSLDHWLTREKLPPRQNLWLRARGPVPEDGAIRAAVLAYFSDLTLLDTSTYAHGRITFDDDLQVASLDHAIWFHRPPDLDDWLLYACDSPSSSSARGFSRGELYSRDGTLIASVAQEGLIRVRTRPASRQS